MFNPNHGKLNNKGMNTVISDVYDAINYILTEIDEKLLNDSLSESQSDLSALFRR